ncbi:Abhydrolase-3 domain-containing protein [Favolaschia claudopus]|uniref:Abhydrolase-3 domain-containing protein n=1 Tax=Favolaschia claudopus TaxID=2862362 RepID=A0AAW0A9W3_9AGAR
MSKVRKYSGHYAPWRHQPMKSIYLLYELVTAFIRIPYWGSACHSSVFADAIDYSGLRPRKSWSWARAMNVQLIRHLSNLSLVVGPIRVSPSYLALVPGIGYHGVWVEPLPSEHILGKLKIWIAAAGVTAVKLPGYWLHKSGSTIEGEAPLMPGEKIVYALHGGAYTRMSAHPSDPTAGIARGLLDRVDTHPFPTALLDALTGYNYLVNTLHIPASDIIVEGDSAGGNLALALTRYLVEHPMDTLPPPALLLLLSPWCDLGTSHSGPGSSWYTRRDSDYIAIDNNGSAVYAIAAFTGPFGLGASELNSYISPASVYIQDISFVGFPPTFISAGGAEILLDSIRTLHEKMAKDTKVRYLEAEDGIHDFLVFDRGWHEPERSETLSAIAQWVTEEAC